MANAYVKLPLLLSTCDRQELDDMIKDALRLHITIEVRALPKDNVRNEEKYILTIVKGDIRDVQFFISSYVKSGEVMLQP